MEVDYSKVLPTTPPEETLGYLMDMGAFIKDYLVYRVEYYQNPLTGLKEKGVRVTCSACSESAICEYIPAAGCSRSYARAPFGFRSPVHNDCHISGDSVICSWCGESVTALHIGGMPNYGYTTEERYCMTIGRHEDKLVLFGWLFRRFVDKHGQVEFKSFPYEAYVLEEKKIIRLAGYQKNIGSISLFGEWKQRKKYMDTWLSGEFILPWDPEVLNGSTAENSKLNRYLLGNKERYPISYLKLWQKHPQVENLILQGAKKIVSGAIAKELNTWEYRGGIVKAPGINWKEKKPAKMLELNKDEFRICCNEQWGMEDLELYKTARAQEKISLPHDMRVLLRIKNARMLINSSSAIGGGFSIMRCARYLDKQRYKDATILIDYWDMAAEVEWDLTQTSVRFPKDLMAEHNRAMDARQVKRDKLAAEKLAKEIESRKKGFQKTYKKLSAYSWECGDILIRPCKDEEELISEGKSLSHCVSRYAQRIADGATSIFFIRKKDAPETPWFTLELNLKNLQVVQNRGKCNCARTKDVVDFEKKWLEWLHKQIKERKTA